MTKSLSVLVVEDSPDDAILCMRELVRGGYAPRWERVDEPESFRAALAKEGWDLVLTDWSMPCFSALGTLAVLHDMGLDVPCIVITGTVDEATAVQAMRSGAGDILSKNGLSRLLPAVDRELREAGERRERRRAVADLRASEERYRLLFQSSPLPMWLYDTETLAFLQVNDAALLHYGYAREEFLAMTIADIRPPEDVAALRESVAQGSDAPRALWRHRKKDGGIIDVEIGASDFVFEGRRVRLVLANDVTSRLRAERRLRTTEEQLRHAQKMEAVGRLARGIAHDFNNMLSVILSTSSIILTDLPEGDPLRADVEEIEKAGRRSADLTRKLLAFSRQQVVESTILDLNAILADLHGMLCRVLGEDVELVTVPNKDLGNVRADKGHIEQIVMNLVVNARDAMPAGGMLTIETANVVLDAGYVSGHLGANSGPHVMIAVSDTGSGMTAEVQARIFEPFFTTKEPGKGTGLGLATVFGIVQQNGGNIWVYSEVGKGTTFKVYLPRTDEVEPNLAPAAPPVRDARPHVETVLLVEDEDQVRAVARSILQRHGCHVVEASGLDEALRIAANREQVIDLMLTDVVLPKTSGPEIVERVRGLRPGLKVLFMSGYTGEAIVHHGTLASGLPFLSKPFTPDSLFKKVREVLDAS